MKREGPRSQVSAHYYLERSWLLESAFGTADDRSEALAESIAESLR
jgi:hypothetical protein